MALQVKHTKNLAKADGIDNTVVQPSDWNATHTMTAAAGKVLGTLVGSTTVTELPISVDATGQAMTPPSGSTAARPAAPTPGMLRFNSTTSYLETYNGAAWSPVEVFPVGTRMLFQQTAAPTGWTKDTSINDRALRVVSGAVGSGGTVAFSTAFANRSVSGNVSDTTATGSIGGTALTVGQLPSHQHFTVASTGTGTLSNVTYVRDTADYSSNYSYNLTGSTTVASTGLTSAAGSGETHTHSFTGSAHNHSFSTTLDLAVAYVDLIIATKA